MTPIAVLENLVIGLLIGVLIGTWTNYRIRKMRETCDRKERQAYETGHKDGTFSGYREGYKAARTAMRGEKQA